MTKNYMADVAKMLGVELEEEFKLDGIETKYKFTENGLYFYAPDGWWQCSNVMLPRILRGNVEIVKLPWKPKKGDAYYYPGEGFNNVCRALWENISRLHGQINKINGCNFVIKALRKQIAMVPISYGDHWKCPRCGRAVHYDYCKDCGQKLRWN